jgi:SAM-dependent methyltransferase
VSPPEKLKLDRPRLRAEWRAKARFFHDEDTRYLRFLIPPGQQVLELGCGAGHTLTALEPARGVGIDRRPDVVEEGRKAFPQLELHIGDIEDEATLAAIEGTFDFIVLVDTLGMIKDCQELLERLHRFCTADTRLILVYYSNLWDPLLRLAEAMGWKMKEGPRNIFSIPDLQAIVGLADFDPIMSERRLLSPVRLFGLGRVVNRFLGPLPLIRALTLRHYTSCRSQRRAGAQPTSMTVVIPARNERGNIEPTIKRIPRLCDDLEIILIEGHSQDGTLDEMKRVQAAYPDRDLKVMTQPGKGKADAVFAAFDAARGDVLMVLDADLTVPPEQLSKFWDAICSGRGEFINGTRLIYPKEEGAMRFINLIGNRTFSLLFSWLLNQRYTDTLCGTKALRRSHYQRLKGEHAFFGNFDPFGDFHLIFGAAKLNLKTVEIPIRYGARVYGKTNISRFRDGLLLFKMVRFAFLKMKAI